MYVHIYIYIQTQQVISRDETTSASWSSRRERGKGSAVVAEEVDETDAFRNDEDEDEGR